MRLMRRLYLLYHIFLHPAIDMKKNK